MKGYKNKEHESRMFFGGGTLITNPYRWMKLQVIYIIPLEAYANISDGPPQVQHLKCGHEPREVLSHVVISTNNNNNNNNSSNISVYQVAYEDLNSDWHLQPSTTSPTLEMTNKIHP